MSYVLKFEKTVETLAELLEAIKSWQPALVDLKEIVDKVAPKKREYKPKHANSHKRSTPKLFAKSTEGMVRVVRNGQSFWRKRRRSKAEIAAEKVPFKGIECPRCDTKPATGKLVNCVVCGTDLCREKCIPSGDTCAECIVNP